VWCEVRVSIASAVTGPEISEFESRDDASTTQSSRLLLSPILHLNDSPIPQTTEGMSVYRNLGQEDLSDLRVLGCICDKQDGEHRR